MVQELRNLSDFNSAISTAGSKILCVMYHNGCRTEENDYDTMKQTYGSRVHMVKVNTLNSDDIKNKYADGSSKPYFKAYRNGNLVDEVKYGSWGSNKQKVQDWLARHAGGGGGGGSYNANDGKVVELKTLSDFNNAISNAGSKIMAVCFHNGCRTEENDYDNMKARFPNVHMYKVNTLNSDDIKNKYADGSSKPYFKAYRNGNLVDEVKYGSWGSNKGKVEDWLGRHNGGGGGGSYNANDGKVVELKTLSDFNSAISNAGSKIMAVCYHNGCRSEENDYDTMKSRYPNVHMYKVNTLNSDDIKNKYADGSSKPYFKAYRNGNLVDEVKYGSWGSNKGKVEDWLGRHNGGGGGGSYNSNDGKVVELKTLSDFNSAISNAGSKIMAVCYHNGCRTEENDYDTMKSRYPNVHMYKVNTLNSDDIKNKYADGSSKPYFKAYRNGNLVDEVKYGSWGSNKGKVEDWLGRHNGGGGGGSSYTASDGKVYELKTLADFNSAVSSAGSKIMCVCYHNGCPTPERAFDGMKSSYPNVHMYKVNTLNSDDIKNKYADGSAKPYFKFYRNGVFDSEVKYKSNWSDNEPVLRDALQRANGGGGGSGGTSGSYNSGDGRVYELKNISEFNNAVATASNKIMAVCYHNGCPTAEKGWDNMKSSYPNVHMYKVNTLNANDIKQQYADGASKPYFKFYKNGTFLDDVKYQSNWSNQEPAVKEKMSRHNSGASTQAWSYSSSGKVYQLKNIQEFNSAVATAGSKFMAVCFHNGCRTEEDGWDNMKATYSNVHMYKVNTLNADDIKNAYADGSSKPYWKFYVNGIQTDELKYKKPWESQKPLLEQKMSGMNSGSAPSANLAYNVSDGKVKELKDMSEFDLAMSACQGKVMAVCFHNGCPTAEKGYDNLKAIYPNVHLYKVNTLNSHDIRDKYADGGSKPYFKFYRNGALLDQVKYESNWSNQEPKVKDSLSRHNGGGDQGSYSATDGKVKQLKNLSEFNTAVNTAGSKIMAVCYHNGCPTAEKGWDEMKGDYMNVHMYKVNTLDADDIKAKYADGSSKPYFKFYKNGQMVDEVKYMSNWSSHEPKVREAMRRHNGGGISYTSSGSVYELKNLKEFNEAVDAAGSKIMAVCYHNGCPTAEKGFDAMKAQYPNVHLYKVNTLDADDIKAKYADGSSKPYFKFYNKGSMVDEVKYESNWSSHEPKVRSALAKHNGGNIQYNSGNGKVQELKNLNEFNDAMGETQGNIMAVMFHNGNPNQEKEFDGMKSQYPNVHMYKVNTLNSYDIRDKYADGGSKPYFKFYKNFAFQDQVKYDSWGSQEQKLKDSLNRHNGGNSGTYSSSGKVTELKDLNQFNSAISAANGAIMAVCYHNGCPTEEQAWDGMKSEYSKIHMYKVNTLNSDDIKNKYADGSSKPYWKFYKNGNLQEEVKYKKPWSDQEPILRQVMAKNNGGGGGYSTSGKVVELKNMTEFNDAVANAGSKIMGVCFHNGCATAEDGWDNMKSEYTNVHMYKVNTLNSYDIRDKYADGGSKPYFKFYKNGNLVNEVNYQSSWAKQEPAVRVCIAGHNGSGGGAYETDSGVVYELKNLSEFNDASSAAGSKVMAVCFHNGNPTAEKAWDKMKATYRDVHLYKVNTIQAKDIRDKYADGGSKPYFKFYSGGNLLDEVKYESNWSSHEPKVRAAMSRHNGGGGQVEIKYDKNDGKVQQLENLGEFNGAIACSKDKIMAVCFHNGNPTPEKAWDQMKKDYDKVQLYKVNTLKADDIKSIYADGSAKPFFKFYKNGQLQDEVKYKSNWSENEPIVKAALARHNGDKVKTGYDSSNGVVTELGNLGDFNKAIDEAGSNLMCVMYHNGNPTPEAAFDKMKSNYPKVHMYKVNTLNSDDIKSKYADGSAKPYFKFYSKGEMIDQVKYMQSWNSNEPNLKAALKKAQDGSMLTQGNSVQSYSSYTKVYQLKNIGEFDSAVKTSGNKIMCVMYHNGNPTQEEDFDGLKQDYTNVHMYKVNTLEADDIKSKYADGSSKPYFKFYKAGSKIEEIKYAKWSQQEIDLKAALAKHDGQDANTSAVKAQQKLEGDLKAAEAQAASKQAEAEKSKKERAEAEAKAKAAEEKAAQLEAQLRAMQEAQNQAAAAKEAEASQQAKALEEKLKQMQEETRRQQEEANRKKEEEEYQRKMAEEAAATKKREEEETARKKKEAEEQAKAAAQAAAEEAAAAAKEAAKPKDGGAVDINSMTIEDFFTVVAKEWNKPLAKLQQYLENLQDEMIDTVKDLDLQVSDEKAWGEITASWPKALPKRIEAKLNEIKAAAAEGGSGGKNAFAFAHKECWIFYEPEYEILRSAPGNDKLGDLPATTTDAQNAKRIALRMGIPESNIKMFTKMTTKSVQSVFRDGTRTFLNKNADGKRSFLLVYCAGHGVCDQMQYFVLNDAEHNLVNIEEKLRTLSKGTDTSILTFYDICRSDKSAFPNLKRGVEAGSNDTSEGFAENYQYMHICTHPLQTVDAKSKLAELTIKQLTRKSGEDSSGLIYIPNCFIGMGGIEKTDTGDGYSLTWKKND